MLWRRYTQGQVSAEMPSNLVKLGNLPSLTRGAAWLPFSVCRRRQGRYETPSAEKWRRSGPLVSSNSLSFFACFVTWLAVFQCD
jgi:hypothetical protein